MTSTPTPLDTARAEMTQALDVLDAYETAAAHAARWLRSLSADPDARPADVQRAVTRTDRAMSQLGRARAVLHNRTRTLTRELKAARPELFDLDIGAVTVPRKARGPFYTHTPRQIRTPAPTNDTPPTREDPTPLDQAGPR